MLNKDIQQIYKLIDKYLLEQISNKVFCDEFYYIYSLGIDKEKLSHNEKKIFSELDEVVSRFSQYPEDHELDSNAFYTEEELKAKIFQTKLKLVSQ